jgi:hypothetical protein
VPTNPTQKQIEASRRNGANGGVKTIEGKAVSRLNARKHGIFASALTDYDQEEVRGIHAELVAGVRPVGAVEEVLVEKLAHAYLRLQRCARAEAEYHSITWEKDMRCDALRHWARRKVLGMRTSNFSFHWFRRSVELFSRYDTTLTNHFLKILHEIERIQRMRLGDNVAAPVVADVTVHGVEAVDEE